MENPFGWGGGGTEKGENASSQLRIYRVSRARRNHKGTISF
jgi:hypothetical protein